MRIEILRRVALASSVLAGLAIAVAGASIATTSHNLTVAEDLQERLHEHKKKAGRKGNDTLADVHAELKFDIHGGPADWSRVVSQVTPSAVSVSTIRSPAGRDEANPAWSLPGVIQNPITHAMALRRSWSMVKADSKREWHTSGAGFIIDDGRHVLTAGHVLEGKESVRVRLANGEWRAAAIVGIDAANDIGLIEIEGDPQPPIAPAALMPRVGQHVLTVGAPNGHEFAASEAMVSRYGREGVMFEENIFMLVTGPIVGGNSGGPIVNGRGEAVAVVSYGSSEVHTQTIPINRAMAVAAALRQPQESSHALP